MARRPGYIEPAPGNEAFAALLDEQARALGLVDAQSVADRRELARRAGLAATTLNAAVANRRWPSTRTLLALEEVTGVPVDRWLEALGYLERPERGEDGLTPAERRLLAYARRRGDAWINRTLDWLQMGEQVTEGPDSGRA